MSDYGRLYIDGAARGNPGPAAYAAILEVPGQPPVRRAAAIGTATNNVAEYTALLQGLKLAAEQGIHRLDVFSDSELLVKQMQGHYRVRHPELLRLFHAVQQLLSSFEQVRFTHVRRENNAEADRLANAALDGQPTATLTDATQTAERPTADPFAISATASPLADILLPSTAEQTIRAILQQAAQTWATGGADALDVEQVWNQIRAVLEEHVRQRAPRSSHPR